MKNDLKTLLLVAVLASVCGCAAITGTVTGAFTGAVDFPVITYQQNQEAFEKFPVFYGLDALVIGPIGLVTGPFMGFVKGVSLDVQWLVGHVDYGDAFGAYGESSIWRPHTIKWPLTTNSMQESVAQR